MPTPTRREFVWRRARNEFEASRRLDSAAEIRDALQLAGTQLQTLEVQGPHLTKLQAAMPDRFESADDAVGLMYADTTGTRPTRTQISAAVRQHALRATARHALEHCVCRAPSGCSRTYMCPVLACRRGIWKRS
jgi:hypothetical protein